MDYEKAYKEALNEAIIAYKDEDRHLKATLERIFPELKEDDDELTWLTNYISEEAYSLSMDIRDDIDRIKLKSLQKSLAWLRKQGKQKSVEWNEEEQQIIKDAACVILACVNTADTREEEEKLEELANKLQDLKHHKQVEQKLAKKYGITGIGSKHAEGKLGEMIKKK